MSLDIKNRISILLISSVVIATISIAAFLQYKSYQENRILETSQVKFDKEIASIIKLKGESLYQVSYDYTYWDEFVENIPMRSPNWYDDNINTIIESFHFDYVDTYDKEFNRVYSSTSDLFQTDVEIPVQIIERLKINNFDHFYLQTDLGYLEIRGASVHPTFDVERNQTDPYGYFFVGKLWDADFIENLGLLSGSKVQIGHDIDHDKKADKFSMMTSYDMLDWDGQHLSHIDFQRTDEALILFDQTILYMILFFVIILLLIVLACFYALEIWVSRPLSQIMNTLKNQSRSEIELIKKAPGEFSLIGTLLEQHALQKEELVLAKEKAEESDRLKTEFLSNLSHEIRTPMNGILGFADLIREPDLLDEDKQLYVGIIEKSVNRLLKVINNLIDISKINTGFVALNIDTRIVDTYLEQISAQFLPEAIQKGIVLSVDNQLDDKTKSITTDIGKLDTILSNLIKNAITHTEKGQIKIGCALKHNMFVFFVSDNGMGIPIEKQQIIFNKFVKADSSLKNNAEGAGLGLAIAKAYVEMLDGSIWVESKLNEGSTFYFSIPSEIRKAA